jgi:hypothetical protein
MTVSAASVAEMQQFVATAPESHADDLQALQTREELCGYLCAVARAEGWNEPDAVELFVRAADWTPGEVRRVEHVMRRLGYAEVSSMMRRIAGRRKHVLAPVTHDTA